MPERLRRPKPPLAKEVQKGAPRQERGEEKQKRFPQNPRDRGKNQNNEEVVYAGFLKDAFTKKLVCIRIIIFNNLNFASSHV